MVTFARVWLTFSEFNRRLHRMTLLTCLRSTILTMALSSTSSVNTADFSHDRLSRNQQLGRRPLCCPAPLLRKERHENLKLKIRLGENIGKTFKVTWDG